MTCTALLRIMSFRRYHIVPLAPTRAEAQCGNCGTKYTVDRDEDGFTEVETTRCANPNCPVLLCPGCAQFKCAGCDRTFCLDHGILEKEPEVDCRCTRIDVDQYDARGCPLCDPEYQFNPLLFCPACIEEMEMQEIPVEEQVQRIAPGMAEPAAAEWGGVA